MPAMARRSALRAPPATNGAFTYLILLGERPEKARFFARQRPVVGRLLGRHGWRSRASAMLQAFDGFKGIAISVRLLSRPCDGKTLVLNLPHFKALSCSTLSSRTVRNSWLDQLDNSRPSSRDGQRCSAALPAGAALQPALGALRGQQQRLTAPAGRTRHKPTPGGGGGAGARAGTAFRNAQGGAAASRPAIYEHPAHAASEAATHAWSSLFKKLAAGHSAQKKKAAAPPQSSGRQQPQSQRLPQPARASQPPRRQQSQLPRGRRPRRGGRRWQRRLRSSQGSSWQGSAPRAPTSGKRRWRHGT